MGDGGGTASNAADHGSEPAAGGAEADLAAGLEMPAGGGGGGEGGAKKKKKKKKKKVP